MAAQRPHLPPLWTHFLYVAGSVELLKIIAQAILDFVHGGPSEKLGVVEEIQEMPLLWITPRTGLEI